MLSLIRKWWPTRNGQALLRVSLGDWRERGRWPKPGGVFYWSGWLTDVWSLVKSAAWHRHDRLVIPTLPPTWNEWDDMLLHAAMAIFGDYMRAEHGGRWSLANIDRELAKVDIGPHSREWYEGYRPTAMEMEAIHRWWTVERDIERQEEQDALIKWHDVYTAASRTATSNPRLNQTVLANAAEADRLLAIHHEIEERNAAKDEEMLMRLVKIRRHLWT